MIVWFIYLFFILPLISIFLGLFVVIFTERAGEIEKNKYRNRLLLWLSLTCLFILLGEWSHEYFTNAPQEMDRSYSQADGIISMLLLWLIPILFFSISIGNAAKRLNAMGYNRFISLLGHLPGIGFPFLIWLAFTKKVSHKKN